jgi:hypothetical protein
MTDEAATVTAPAPAPPVEAAPVPAAEPPAAPPPEDVASLPEWTQKMIRELRTEAATNRTKATTAEATKAETMDAIAKALGLKGDDDPAAAAKTAAEERDAARKQAQDATTTLAVYRMAAKQGANPESLTDSRSFMRQLEAIDPADAEFAAKVETAIKTAVEANPSLKAPGAPVVAPARSGGPVGGGAPIPGQVTEDELKTMNPAQIEQAQKDGRLNAILGRQPED